MIFRESYAVNLLVAEPVSSSGRGFGGVALRTVGEGIIHLLEIKVKLKMKKDENFFLM